MLKRIVWFAAFIVLTAAVAQAQEPRTELGFNLGYTTSEGLKATDVFNNVNYGVGLKPKSSFSWNFDLGHFVSPKIEIGGLFAQQNSQLQFNNASGAFKTVPKNWNVNNIDGTVAFNTGNFDSKARFYVLGGLGFTRYTSQTIDLQNPILVNGGSVSSFEIRGATKFNTTWGAGAKFYPAPKFGLKMGVRWTPTALGSLSDEWLCGPYLNCAVIDKDRIYSLAMA